MFPRLLKDRDPDQPLRVWVPGCSTGEEAYSLAISLLESIGEKRAEIPIQIFATDISGAAIEKARLAGLQTLAAELGRSQEGFAVATFDLDAIARQRASWGLFRDRRPDLYGALTSHGGNSLP